MRRFLPVIIESLLLAPVLLTAGLGQSIPGLNATSTPEIMAEIAMGHAAGHATDNDETRSLTFEEADDPTFAAISVLPHEPPRGARKAAEIAGRLARKKRHEAAIAKYREGLAIDPLYYEAANNLALELEAVGNIADAESMFRRLMQSLPEHVLAFTNLAGLLCASRQFAEAEEVLRQAMKRHTYSFKANYMLGAVLVEEGRWSDEAQTKLEYAQLKYPAAKALLEKWPGKAVN